MNRNLFIQQQEQVQLFLVNAKRACFSHYLARDQLKIDYKKPQERWYEDDRLELVSHYSFLWKRKDQEKRGRKELLGSQKVGIIRSLEQIWEMTFNGLMMPLPENISFAVAHEGLLSALVSEKNKTLVPLRGPLHREVSPQGQQMVYTCIPRAKNDIYDFSIEEKLTLKGGNILYEGVSRGHIFDENEVKQMSDIMLFGIGI